LHSTLLNVEGPFQLITALRAIEPGQTAPIKITFTPNATAEVCFIQLNKSKSLKLFY